MALKYEQSNKNMLKITSGDFVAQVPLLNYSTALSKNPNAFHLLNSYFEYLERSDKEAHDRIVSALSDAVAETITVRLLYEDRDDGRTPEQTLKEHAHAVMTAMNYDMLVEWLSSTPEFVLPNGIKLEFNPTIITDAQGSREQTYIKDDYIRLAALALISKAMIPLYVTYLSGVDIAPRNKLRDFKIFTIINDHPLFETDAAKRLFAYIDKTMEKYVGNRASASNNKPEIIANVAMAGVNSDDLELFMLAGIFVSKLPTSNITENGSKSNLVTNTHSFIKNNLTFETQSKSKLKNKEVADSGGDDEDKTSTLEKYNTVTSKLVLGSVVELNHYYRDIRRVIANHFPDRGLRITRIDRLRSRLLSIPDFEVSFAQSTILGWVLMGAIDPRAIPYLYKDTVCGLLALASEILWQSDVKEISLYMTAVPFVPDDNVASLTTKARVPKQLQEDLITHYPHKKRVNTKDRKRRFLDSLSSGTVMLAGEENIDTASPLAVVLKDASSDIFGHNWKPVNTPEEVEEVTGMLTPVLEASSDIKTQLARILVLTSEALNKNEEKVVNDSIYQ